MSRGAKTDKNYVYVNKQARKWKTKQYKIKQNKQKQKKETHTRTHKKKKIRKQIQVQGKKKILKMHNGSKKCSSKPKEDVQIYKWKITTSSTRLVIKKCNKIPTEGHPIQVCSVFWQIIFLFTGCCSLWRLLMLCINNFSFSYTNKQPVDVILIWKFMH